MPTVKETFDAMAGRFQPSKAVGMNATIQYDITGDQSGTWHAVIKDGACAVNEGAATNPNLTLSMSSQDWLHMIGREAPPWGRVRGERGGGDEPQPHPEHVVAGLAQHDRREALRADGVHVRQAKAQGRHGPGHEGGLALLRLVRRKSLLLRRREGETAAAGQCLIAGLMDGPRCSAGRISKRTCTMGASVLFCAVCVTSPDSKKKSPGPYTTVLSGST